MMEGGWRRVEGIKSKEVAFYQYANLVHGFMVHGSKRHEVLDRAFACKPWPMQ